MAPKYNHDNVANTDTAYIVSLSRFSQVHVKVLAIRSQKQTTEGQRGKRHIYHDSHLQYGCRKLIQSVVDF